MFMLIYIYVCVCVLYFVGNSKTQIYALESQLLHARCNNESIVKSFMSIYAHISYIIEFPSKKSLQHTQEDYVRRLY